MSLEMVLILDDIEKKAVESLVTFASRPENWYKADSDWSPGDRPEYVVGLTKFNQGENTGFLYRCVFTWSVFPPTHGNIMVRHLSVGYAREGRMPNPPILETITAMFGFTGAETASNGMIIGPGEDWGMRFAPGGYYEAMQEIPNEEVEKAKKA
jgi:hypothetical protein